MQSPKNKLDARSRWQLAEGKLKGPVEAVLRLEFPPSVGEQQALSRVVSQVRSQIGPIITAIVDVAALPKIAQLPFVQSIQLSKPLYTEKK